MEKKSKKLQKSYFDVLGICCSSEVPLIENILKPLEGIKEVSVIVPSRTVIVLHDTLAISQLQIDGTCEVDEKTLTGESFPVAKQKDSTVWAGTINLNGYISVKTTALAQDCVVAKMTKLVEEAQNSKTSASEFVNKFYYTPG